MSRELRMPLCFLLIGVLFVRISFIASALVICLRCIRGPTEVKRPPTSLRHCPLKTIYHCGNVDGSEERSGRPFGHVVRDPDCLSRGPKELDRARSKSWAVNTSSVLFAWGRHQSCQRQSSVSAPVSLRSSSDLTDVPSNNAKC